MPQNEASSAARISALTLAASPLNPPFKTVSAVVSCLFILNADWGTWAQIEIGDTTAWIDTSTVRLDPS